MNKRIVLVGAGSALFTRGLLGSLVLAPEFEESALVLMDINPESLLMMERYGRKLLDDNKYGLKLEATTDLGQALDGADFVVCTIAANDREARKLEIDVPLSFGYRHSWGDTTGPSGVFRALRHIPVFLDIATGMERWCPDAWLLNFTNPMAALCRAVTRQTNIKTLGFCDSNPEVRMLIEKEVLDLPEGSLKTKMAGVDHLVYILEMTKDGEDVYPQFAERIERLRPGYPATVAMFETYGFFITAGDNHMAEFFPFLLNDEATMRECGLKDMDIDWHRKRRQGLIQLVVDELESTDPLSPSPLPPEEEVLDIIRSIADDDKKEYVASLPNNNVISNLPDYAIAEAGIRLGAEVEQLPPVSIPPLLTGPMHASIVKDELVVEAALTCNRGLVFQAVLSCPLIRSISQAAEITSAMFDALENYIPGRFV
ncbi:MAG: hypothetical protein U9P14_02395 [Gemmatimonadota bacterium]|nr:hypothetical protein [Gemmatimonadota bacterium]